MCENKVILVGIPSCKACKRYHEQHPELEYVELGDISASKREIDVKKAVYALDVAGYPVILSDSLNRIVLYPVPF